MMMVFLVLLGIEGLSYMLNDENKKRLLLSSLFSLRLSQNRVGMASFVLFQIEVIWIFLKKRSLQTYFFHSNCFLLV